MNYRQINSKRQFKDSTGHSKDNFLILLKDFEDTFFLEKNQTYEEYIKENVTESPKLKTLGDALFFVLFQLKNDLIFGSLGVIFEMSEATAHYNFKKFSILLELTLKKKVMPKRKFKNVEEFDLAVSEAKELIFDGVENLTERPKNNERQKAKYSGKKHTHTDIAMVLSDKKTKIYYISELYDGHNVDFGIFKKEFPPKIDWFKNSKILVDLGFVGIAKLYNIKELLIGYKKPRKSKGNPNPILEKDKKEINKNISKERIFVEHAIGKTKRFRILKNRCRLKCQEMKNRILGICAALWNYHLELNN